MDEVEKIKNIEKVYTYWLTSSDNDYGVMNNLYAAKNYNWALFCGLIIVFMLPESFTQV